METVFITIHDLSLDARIKYCSDSVEDILGYLPHEVKGKSCWEYFHPEEMPFAKAVHSRGIALDKAASLNYCRIKHKDGRWIGCECVFTVVYDVLVASTAIYQCGPNAQRRAVEGANIRRIFSSSPRDPRYHMLSYISNKFSQSPNPHEREPRAALILNRFTRTSTVMFATNGVEQILGLQPKELVGKSFYYCVVENCLRDAVRTLESAKGNDSIAYLRFYFRDPRQPDPPPLPISESVSEEEDYDDDDGGVTIASSVTSHTLIRRLEPNDLMDRDQTPQSQARSTLSSSTPEMLTSRSQDRNTSRRTTHLEVQEDRSRASSGNSTDVNASTPDAIFDPPSVPALSSASSVSPHSAPSPCGLEIEAVVSCTSDGMVVVVRRALPMIPETATRSQPSYPNGLFASPWAFDPILPDSVRQATVAPSISFPPSSEPTESGLMAAIRDVAVFAWSLTGINGSLADLANGDPRDEAVPPGGLPIWDPNATEGADDRYNGFLGGSHRPIKGRGNPFSPNPRDEDTTSSSEDEILWKRVPQMPAFKRPRRRRHHDAFGTEGQNLDKMDEDTSSSQIRRRKLGDGSRGSSV